ncbi:transglycosylase domain-containing protein [Propioniciclava soli]|uniref:transglycosylase domain-containing protein n=1 Tax=Propioniciclava soli TaxID=2775081 RepID=UPI0022B778FA|nr:transglycosylase domain-containing protein [Propioniciclava soli]
MADEPTRAPGADDDLPGGHTQPDADAPPAADASPYAAADADFAAQQDADTPDDIFREPAPEPAAPTTEETSVPPASGAPGRAAASGRGGSTAATGRALRRNGKPKRPLGVRILAWVVGIVAALAVAGAIAFGIFYAMTPIPNPNADFQTNNSHVYYADGTTELGTFAIQNRETVAFDQISQHAKDAVVASENATFWEDSGISIPGMLRAVQTALTPGEATVGGSTITQQYVKVLYLTQDRTIARKLNEIVIALKVSQEVSKEDILAGYLNTVYFGRGAYGIEAASQSYFGVSAADLSLPQAIALTAIINSPNNLDPHRGEQAASDLLERYQYTINQMVVEGHMTEAERDEIYTTLPEFPDLPSDSRFGGPNGFLLKMVQDELTAAGLEDSQISGGGLRIVTTVNPAAQAAAIEAAQNQARRIASAQGQQQDYYHPAIASLDTATGGIVALYAGPDYTSTTDSRNWATTARPTGSTFKPWALVAGLRDGATLQTRLNGNEFTLPGEKQPISNAGGRNYGPVTLQQATTSSINSAYIDLVVQMEDGPQKVIQAAEDVGIRNPGWQPYPSIALGVGEVSPVDAARGLATLVNEGQRTTPHIVAEVTDPTGDVIHRATIAPEQTVETEVARNAVAALTGVVNDGTARSVRALGYEVAGKTGTYYISALQETRATWFIGSTKQISTAFVLTAGPEGQSNLGRNTYGSTYAAQGWLEYMRTAMEGQERLTFPDATRTRASGNFSAIPVPQPTRTTSAPAPAPTTATATAEPTPEATDPTTAPTDAPPADAPPTAAPTTPPTEAPDAGTDEGTDDDTGGNG